MDMAIELAQKIEDNQRMYLGSTLPIFAFTPVMTPALQMATVSFAAQTQDSNEQLIDRLTANLAQLLELLNQAVRENQQSQRLRFESRFNQPQQSSYQRQQNRGSSGENASQPEKNSFYAFNLTDDDHDMDKLAINISELTRKKKKAKVDFVLDPKKSSTSTANNNELLKVKVFKNPPKLEPPKIVQKFGLYFVVKDLMEMPVHIIFGQLMTHLQFRKDFHKSLIPKKKTPKINKCFYQAGLTDNSNVTPLICKAQVAGYFIDLILDSGSSVSVIAKHFLEAIGRKIDKLSTRPMTNVHGDKKKGLGIAKAIPVCINGISIETDMELKKAKALLDYKLCKLTIRYGEKPIVVKCHHWTTSPTTKQNQEEKQSNELDDNKNNDKKDQEEQKEITKLTYTIFTSNGKPLDNVKADKERIMVNGKLICWPYYDILRRIFDRKPNKKAKYSYWWHGSCVWCWCNKPLYLPSDKYKSCLIYYKD
ncbi:hypothetical protein G9A89_012754 [Geosiphon pyriformis]|nr:hypothetical protein G9A89_012754 [Geosiphon pyriformis]